MFVGYKIVNNVLCLYVDDRYEFGGFKKGKQQDIKEKIYEYIKKNNIKFSVTKVILLISGLMLCSVILNTDKLQHNYDVYNGSNYVINLVNKNNNYQTYETADLNVEDNNRDIKNDKINTSSRVNKQELVNNDISKNNNDISKNNSVNYFENTNINNSKAEDISNSNAEEKIYISGPIIHLLRSNGTTLDISINDYLIGVVASEMPASFNIEALKVQSVISRTYVMKLMENGRTITDDNRTQIYKDNGELKSMWGSNYDIYYNKIKTAVEQTADLKIKYNGNLIDAVYFSTSNGYTEDSYNVWNNSYDYLKSVPSSWDTSASTFLRETNISFNEISNLLNIDFNSIQNINIISRNSSNRVDKVSINDNIYSGVELRNKLKLRSADFDFEIQDGFVKFITRGYGHGVGLSQYGANAMANAGYGFDEIIRYYYTGVYIE